MFKSKFNLEEKIADWRKQMLAAGITGPDTLEELESHLREDFRALVLTGEADFEAFGHALARLGAPRDVRVEFKKLTNGEDRQLKTVAILWLGAVAAMALVLFLSRGLFRVRLNLILYLHILTVTLGYVTALLLGLGGIYQLFRERFQARLPIGNRLFARAAQRFSLVSATLVIAAVVLGTFASRQIFGSYWRWDPKEIGGVCVVGWFLAMATMQHYGWLNDRSAILMCVGGNIVVALAWFGAGIMDYNERMHGHGGASYWPLAICVGVHLCFIGMGIAAETRAPASRT
jgi:hypothetical protein